MKLRPAVGGAGAGVVVGVGRIEAVGNAAAFGGCVMRDKVGDDVAGAGLMRCGSGVACKAAAAAAEALTAATNEGGEDDALA